MPEVIDLLLLGAGQMVTCNCPEKQAKRGEELDDVGLVNDGAVAVAGGKILFCGPREEVLRKTRNFDVKEILDVGGRVILPGWVDPHTHAVFTEYRSDEFEARIKGRSYLEIEKAGGGIMRTVKGVRQAGEETLFRLSERRLNKTPLQTNHPEAFLTKIFPPLDPT